MKLVVIPCAAVILCFFLLIYGSLLEVDFGEEKRQIVSGIAEFFEPDNLVGKQVPVLCNLEAREIRGIESQGMILAVIDNDEAVLLHPHKEVSLGSVIR